MKLTKLNIRYKYYPEGELDAEAEFSGNSGKMIIPITEQDVQDIQQLLLNKTKELASEA
jgi:hypothetical protein